MADGEKKEKKTTALSFFQKKAKKPIKAANLNASEHTSTAANDNFKKNTASANDDKKNSNAAGATGNSDGTSNAKKESTAPTVPTVNVLDKLLGNNKSSESTNATTTSNNKTGNSSSSATAANSTANDDFSPNSKGKIVTNLETVKREEEERRLKEERSNKPAWAAAPGTLDNQAASSSSGSGGGGAYSASKGYGKGSFSKGGASLVGNTYQAGTGFGGSSHGNFSTTNNNSYSMNQKFPTLGTGLQSSNVEVGPGSTVGGGGSSSYKAPMSTANNAFGNLEVGDDSDEEEAGILRPALLKKEKGQVQINLKKQLGASLVNKSKMTPAELAIYEAEEREQDEKALKKKQKMEEKEIEKKKKEEDRKRKERERKAQKEMECNREKFDTSRFKYGLFNITACEEKYANRVKVGA